ncbi:hypothetical protein GCM10010377_73140 [Streptomyces viridiviolaceus]|nr:hypothetical protein GCM10010377_73140 [Streptomyces viridiviolaceus]
MGIRTASGLAGLFEAQLLQVEFHMLDVGEADLLQGAGAAAAVLEVDLFESFGGDLLQLPVGGAGLLGVEEAGGVLRRQRETAFMGSAASDSDTATLSLVIDASSMIGSYTERERYSPESSRSP